MDIRRHSRHYHKENNPSFSSTLLDAIYRSIDESNDREDKQEMAFCRETTKKKHSSSDKGNSKACMIEKWIEEKHTYEQKVSTRRKSMAEKESHDHHYHRHQQQPVLLNSSSSSSESSSGGGFSSSESDSFYNAAQIQRPKPIRTSASVQSDKYQTGGVHNGSHRYNNQNERNSAPKRESSNFTKTKSKALKIYSDLKKAKQPISPGGRLASFLNSLFSTANNAKQAKNSSYDERKSKSKSKSEQNSTCSSASSFSRSCLSKTPSSRGNPSTETKRSVRFYPVSVIVGENSRPCGHKNVYENVNQPNSPLTAAETSDSIGEELKLRVMSESRRVEEVARELLMSYQKKQEEEEDEEDDGESCASSDLFELENLSAIGIERYCEELPVYETTRITANRAIVNGLIL